MREKLSKSHTFKGDKDITVIILALFKRGVRFSELAIEILSFSREKLCLLNSGSIYKREAFAFSRHYDQDVYILMLQL